MSGRSCPVGCGRAVRSGMLACAPCWREIPKHLQREVLRTWNAWRRDFGDADKMHAYTEASDNAIASIQ